MVVVGLVVFMAFLVVLALTSTQLSRVGKPANGPSSPGKGTGTDSVIGTSADIATRCPWLKAAMDRAEPPAQLAALVEDRMNVSEKVSELVLYSDGDYENINAGVPRLCIPSLAVQDGPQGLAYGDTNVTQLPSPLGVAATFNTATARAYGVVEGSEAPGQGIDAIQGPTLNIDRVPESGRSYEGYGEDPVLVSAMGVADIEGIQSTGTMAMAKHFAVYNQETDRGVLDDQVSERALHELYLPPFEAAVSQAHVALGDVRLPAARTAPSSASSPSCSDCWPVGVHRLRPLRPRLGARPGGRHRVRHRPHQTGERRPAGRTGAAGPASSVVGRRRCRPASSPHVHPSSGGPVRGRPPRAHRSTRPPTPTSP